MKQKVRTTPDLADSSPKHQVALVEDKDFRGWERNVADNLKGLSDKEISQKLQETSNPFAVMFENWRGDFNLATGIRNANGFNAKEVFYIGNHKWDRRGAIGVYNYTPVQWIANTEELVKLQERYTFIGVDNVPGSIPMETFSWPHNSLLIFGEESTGLTPGIQAMCKHIVHIQMYGSVRSFNCGTASGIAMYDFVSKYRHYK